MSSLALRMANKQAIMKVIEARQGKQASAIGQLKSYAGVVKQGHPTKQPQEKPMQDTSTQATQDNAYPPINSPASAINGVNQLDRCNTTTKAEQGQKPWILVSHRKQ